MKKIILLRLFFPGDSYAQDSYNLQSYIQRIRQIILQVIIYIYLLHLILYKSVNLLNHPFHPLHIITTTCIGRKNGVRGINRPFPEWRSNLDHGYFIKTVRQQVWVRWPPINKFQITLARARVKREPVFQQPFWKNKRHSRVGNR